MPQKKSPPYDALLWEQLHSKMDLILESVTEWRSELITRMDERFAKQDARFDVIEGVLHQHSMRFSGIEDRLDRVETRLDRVEQRLDRVEVKLDDVVVAVKRHDSELQSLRVQ